MTAAKDFDALIDDPSPPRIRTLRQLLSDPEATQLPPATVPRLAWPGRSTLLSGREKSGKSTMVSAASAAVVTGGPFLDGTAMRGSVLYVALEEHSGDVARRLATLGAAHDDAEDVFLLDSFTGEDQLAELTTHCRELAPALVVIDTLAAYARSWRLDSGDSSGWQDLVQSLTDLARATNVAELLLHHAKKNSPEYRDSTAIGGGVDILAELSEPLKKGRLPTERLLSVRGRLGRYQLWCNYENHRFLVDGSGPDAERPIPDRIVGYLAANPGATQNDIIKGVGGRTTETRRTLRIMVQDRLVTRQRKGQATYHYLAEDAPALPAEAIH